MTKQKDKKKGIIIKDDSGDKNKLLNTDFINSVINNHNPSLIINNSSSKILDYIQ
jgi:hypothetical protein